MIKIKVSKEFKNDKLSNILQKDDVSINETILNYGINLYENQSNIIKNYSIDNEIKIKNEELDNLKNEIISISKKYELTIKSVKDDKDKEIDSIKSEKKIYEHDCLLKLKNKETELNDIISNLNKENDNNFQQYLQDKSNIDKSFRDILEKKELEFNSIINKIENDKLSIREQHFKDLNDIENKLKEQYDNKIKYLENDISKLQSEKTLEITSLIEKGKDITKNEYEKYIQLQEKHNTDLKLNYENQIKQLNSKLSDLDIFINKLNTKNEELTNKLFDNNKFNENNKYDSLINNINTLNGKLNDNFDKFYKGNTEKGDFGEKFIESFLSTYFTNCKIIDTHKETAKGDMLFMFDRVKTLIESKNVQTLKKEDIDKFYRDVELRSSKNEINSAILISLNDTNLVNGKRLFHFEIKYNIPIIMISDVFKNQEYIRFSISVFNYLIKNGYADNESDEDKMTFLINCINELNLFFKFQNTFLNYDKQMIIKLEQSFKKRESDLFNVDKIFKNMFTKFPELNTQNNIKDNVKDNDIDEQLTYIINKIKTHPDYLNSDNNFKINIKNLETIGISRNDIKNLETIGISRNDIKNIGGIKAITEYLSDTLVV